MFNVQGHSRNRCSLLAVVFGNVEDDEQKPVGSDDQPKYPFPTLASAGRLEVQILKNPSADEFRRGLESAEPSFVYLQGGQHADSDEVGSLVSGDVDLSNPEALCGFFRPTFPTTVYLEMPNGEELAEALHVKGIPYIIYWKNSFSRYAACHFRHALFSVVQSSCSHTWDAFQLSYASFQLYCVRNNYALPYASSKFNGQSGPCLLGDPPKIDIPPEQDVERKDDNSENLPAIKIYDEDVDIRFLICGMLCELDARLLGALQDGLKALLNIEIRGSKLQSRTSAPPPPLQAGTFNRGVVTMRCDVSTCSSAHVSLLVSGTAQACFNEQLLENHIKNEIIENGEIVTAVSNSDDSKMPTYEPRRSASIACGSSVFEVGMKVPLWASQVLRQLAPEVSYRSLVMLGIASIQGLSVASFEKEDAERFLFFCRRDKKLHSDDSLYRRPPIWFMPPTPSRKRSEPSTQFEMGKRSVQESENGTNVRRKLNSAAMRPIPNARLHKMLPFSVIPEAERYNGDQIKVHMPVVPAKHSAKVTGPVANRKLSSSSYQAQQIISLNPLPLKKHACNRAPIQDCSEEEFLKDVMQFLILRGHNRLVPQGGLAEFPDAVLNAKRLDLFNLYREVVSRGGFHVGNGINWKGQVFSKMRNHTMTNRMTGVGNTLKRHYETYLLEYELAHDDVDGECCLLCHSSAAGDWVNCGICGEWAHFGCDRRQGLGAFKDYAKTDGLDYICPHCTVANFKKPPKSANGY